MKICHITSAHKRYDLRIHTKECATLAENGYETHCVVSDSEGDCVGEDGVYVHSTGYKAKNRLARIFRSSRKAYKLALSLDAAIYHMHDPELLLYALKLKKHGKKVIFDSHEDVINTIEEKTWIWAPIRKMIKALFSGFQKRVCEKIDAIVAVTPVLVEYFKTINSNTFLVTNYPILENVEISDSREKRVCFAGGVEEQWCHDVIVKAVNELPDAEYVYAGRVTDSYREMLDRLTEGNSKYLGFLRRAEVYDLFRHSVAGVALNNALQVQKEGGSLGNTKIFEYMMCGLPVICTDYPNWKGVVEAGNCGICIPNDNVDALKKAIQYLIDNPDQVVEFGRNGQKLIREKYNWDVAKIQLIELYSSLR